MALGMLGMLIPILVVGFVCFTVLRLAEMNRAAPANAVPPQVEERLARLEHAVEELRELVYDAVIDTDDRTRYAGLEQAAGRSVDA